MHTHCEYSFDSQTPLEEQAKAIRAAGLDAVCATDHDTIEGALRLREIADGFRVIVGEEIGSRDGEIIGLFLERVIPGDLSAEETISRIKEQGGLVVVPHPFSPSRPQHLRRAALERLWPQIDALEVLNGREAFPSDNTKAAAFSRERRIPGTAGSDARVVGFVGRLVSFKGLNELMQAWTILRERPHVHLLIVGDVDPVHPLEVSVRRQILNDDRIHVTGFSNRLQELYGAMDLLVMPSHREALGQVLLEAAAMGLPRVCLRIPGASDTVIDGVNGTLVAPGDVPGLASVIVRYLDSESLRVRHGSAARAFVLEHFRPDVAWARMIQIYSGMLAVEESTTRH